MASSAAWAVVGRKTSYTLLVSGENSIHIKTMSQAKSALTGVDADRKLTIY
jgi:hypothetical protein